MEKNVQRPAEEAGKKNRGFLRLVRYLFANYPIHLTVVLVCIVISACASVVATVFLQRLIDECITPGITSGMDAVWPQLISIIATMAVIYVFGVAAAFTYTRIMAIVTQGTLKHFRLDMFDNMESLPVRYFDTHAHGDIMSTYTNDTDAIRQLIGQSLPQLFQAVLTSTAIFLMMRYYSIWLTLVVCVFLVVMLTVSRRVGGASAHYMMAQQKALADEEGYIEEMMDGQKVVQVFCHEEQSKEDFVRWNDRLFEAGEAAHRYGNILMPILSNIGNLMYVLLAVAGGLLVYFGAANIGLSGMGSVTVGIIISFLSMTRQLSQTIGQASMQVSMIAMGVAGANRVFTLIAEEPEQDAGYVKLVNAKKNENGYDTMLTGNGASLSQGQRQLLSIARAAVADPPCMILDEATSSIDTRTEALVQDGMDHLMEGRTVFVIAHRLSTVRNSKAIMVLDHGRIIERGDHDDLIAQKGVYYQLYTGAFELE
ncbi:MAG: ABC transporter ATP-binding protein [Lachnospiraceae bacterium]|nr:ABC transporter ATP-binding protein [Lachnospiraceae bacterium]